MLNSFISGRTLCWRTPVIESADALRRSSCQCVGWITLPITHHVTQAATTPTPPTHLTSLYVYISAFYIGRWIAWYIYYIYHIVYRGLFIVTSSHLKYWRILFTYSNGNIKSNTGDQIFSNVLPCACFSFVYVWIEYTFRKMWELLLCTVVATRLSSVPLQHCTLERVLPVRRWLCAGFASLDKSVRGERTGELRQQVTIKRL